MNAYLAIYAALLFYVLSPGVLLRLSIVGGPVLTHALVFGLVWYLTAKPVYNMVKYY